MPTESKPRRVVRVEKWSEEDHPRADDGKFSESGGGGGSPRDEGGSDSDSEGSGGKIADPKKHNDEQYKKTDGKYHVKGDVEAAVRLIGDGKDVVLEQPRELSTLINRLAAIGNAEASGSAEKKVYDLCRVSVSGTNLFCAESAGYARVDMPQLSGKPTAGSPADSFPKNPKGVVDTTPQFVEHLRGDKGYSVETLREDAGFLRATQRELDGAKVAGMMKAIQEGKIAEETLIVSKDNYIIDGHHRWAAQVALSYAAQVKITMPVMRVNIGVVPLIEEANAFAKQMGIAGRAVGKQFIPASGCALPKPRRVVYYGEEQ